MNRPKRKTRSFGNLLSELLSQRGFCLQKLSQATLPMDVVATHWRKDDGFSEEEAENIRTLMHEGSTFRCRVGRGRFFYGKTASIAIELALKNAKTRPAD